jgi:imidazolonepropionase-like amidohydrolase
MNTLLLLAALAAQPVLAISGGTLVDGAGGPAVPDAVVVIEGERIRAAGPRDRVPVPEGARVLDAKGKWVTPGLVDAHVHFFQSAGLYTRPDVIDLRAKVPYADELKSIRERLPATFRRWLRSGVTATVDVGGPMWNFEVRELARKTEAAPRVAVAGPLVSTYAPAALQTDDPAIIKVADADEARALVRREAERKPDLVKIWFIVSRGGRLDALRPIVRAAVEESHARGIRVAVHATELETARAAVECGCDVLVHSVDDRAVDDAFAALLKEKGVIYTTSMVVFEGYAEVLGGKVDLIDVERAWGDPKAIASWAELPDGPRRTRAVPKRTLLSNLKRLHDAGVVVAAGTDAGNIGTLHGPSLHRELELMAEAGLTPAQVLVAATRNGARVFAREPEFGTVAAGKLADLLVLDADPLADVKHLRKIAHVVKGGRVFAPGELE